MLPRNGLTMETAKPAIPAAMATGAVTMAAPMRFDEWRAVTWAISWPITPASSSSEFTSASRPRVTYT
jgi:hypothetical protein